MKQVGFAHTINGAQTLVKGTDLHFRAIRQHGSIIGYGIYTADSPKGGLVEM